MNPSVTYAMYLGMWQDSAPEPMSWESSVEVEVEVEEVECAAVVTVTLYVGTANNLGI